jgi:hypothetical protein
MTMTSSPTTAPAKTAASPQATLAELVAIVAKHANEQLSPMVARMVSALLDMTGPSCDPAAAAQRIRSGNVLKNNSYAFFHLASTGLERALCKEIELLAPRRSSAQPAVPATLSLVPLEEMDNKIAFGAVTRPFDIAYSEPLATLGVRLGLLLGRGMLRAEQNPFRPEVLLHALHDAWREFEPETAAHGLILPLLRPGIVFDFAPMLEAVNQALQRKGAGDGERFHKTDGAAAAKAAKSGKQAALAQQLRKLFNGDGAAAVSFGDDVPLIPDLPDMPTGSGGWRPSAASGFTVATGAAPASPSPAVSATAPRHFQVVEPPGGGGGGAAGPRAIAAASGSAPGGTAAGAPLLELLGQIPLPPVAPPSQAGGHATGALPHNVFYLPRLKQSLPDGSLTRTEQSTLDLLSRIFETVLLDDNIPPQTRELIQFLQVPVLKAALRDTSFFFEETHPARRMIDLLSRMGWEQRGGQGDAAFQAMQRSVDRVGREAEGKAEAFEQAVADLESSLAAEERAVEAAIAEPIAKAVRQEKQAMAAHQAQQAIKMRLGSGDVVAAVSAFLEQKWTTVLTLAYSIEDDQPGAVGNATRTMDDLIWSVKPKATLEQRKALIARLPSLLGTLNKWLDAIQWQDAQRLQFFAQLAECHAQIVRAPIEASPERQLELAVEAAQQDALRRVALENAAAQREQAPKDEAELAVDSLERGMWLEFMQPDGSARKLKLAWVSPLRTLFIFSAGASRDAFSMPVEKVLEALRAGSASVAAAEGVVGRVLSQAMQDAGNDGEAVAA